MSVKDIQLKEQLILTIFDKLYKDDIENQEYNLTYLNSLTIEELDIMMGNYYLYDIKFNSEN